MAEDALIFSVPSTADFGLDKYYLDQHSYQHILIGHRALQNFVRGIEETVTSPTHVYKSTYHPLRLQFVSYNVVTSRGHPMCVIIEIERSNGRIITASPKNRINGQIVWDLHTKLYAAYDDKADVLYIAHGKARPTYADDAEDDDRVWLRYNEDDDSPAGLTFFAVKSLNRRSIVQRAVDFLNANSIDVEGKVSSLIGE